MNAARRRRLVVVLVALAAWLAIAFFTADVERAPLCPDDGAARSAFDPPRACPK